MKAFILAAGNGTRLRPLTERTPKCLLPIRGTPLLEIWLEHCKRAGIADVLVNAHAHADQVRSFVGGWNGGVRVQLAQEPVLLGSAGTLAQNRSFVAGEEDFFVLYCDVLTDADLGGLLDLHRRRNCVATLGTYNVPEPSRCGIAEVDGRGTVRSFVEKPERPQSNLAFAGVMIARQDIFDSIPKQRPADIGFHLLPKLVGRMAAVQLTGYVLDIGTMESYSAGQAEWPGFESGAKLHAKGHHL